jgi:hypothetical protein
VGGLDQAIAEGGLAVVDMGNNTEISDIVHCLTICGCNAPLPRQCVPDRAAGIL